MDKFGLFLQGCSIFMSLLLVLTLLIGMLLLIAFIVARLTTDKEINPVKYDIVFYSTLVLVVGIIGGGGWLLMP